MDKLQYTIDSSSKICGHMAPIGNVKICLKISITYLLLLEIVIDSDAYNDFFKLHMHLTNYEMFDGNPKAIILSTS